MNEVELRQLSERIVSAAPGTNIVYYEKTLGWSKVPYLVRMLINTLISEGLVQHFIKRDGKHTFSMVVQRTKMPAPTQGQPKRKRR